MKNKLFITVTCVFLFLLFVPSAFANDYIRFNEKGVITQRWKSVDGDDLGIKGKPDILVITRTQLKALTQYFLVKDKKLVAMTTQEKADWDTAEAARIQAEQEAIEKIPTIDKLIAVLEDKHVLTRQEVIDRKYP